ncbi:polysaccharide biosynthesis protein [Phytohabitans suffuscus]|nr:polysaccharide biosynthesis protein [Phytohabitans suffuscus]
MVGNLSRPARFSATGWTAKFLVSNLHRIRAAGSEVAMAQAGAIQARPPRVGVAGAAVAVAGAAANAMAYLVPVVGARQLSAADLGALATVSAIAAIVGVPGLGLQLAVAVHRARHPGAATGRVAWLTAAACAAAVVALTPVADALLHLPPAAIAPLALYTGAFVTSGRWLGELQGDERFVRLAVGMAVLTAGRYGGLVAGLALGAGLTGSILAGTATALLIPPALALLTRPTDRPTDRAAARPDGCPADRAAADRPAGSATTDRAARGGGVRARQVVTASSATLAMLAVSYADLLLARHLLPAASSGAYAVGTVLTKGAIWAPQVVTVIALPRLARGSRRTLVLATALVAASGALLVAASAVAGALAFRLAGGPDYASLGRHAPVFALTGALYALVFVLVNAQVAAGARWPSAPLWTAGAALFVTAEWLAPHTLTGIMWSAAATAALALALSALTLRRPPPP